LKFRVETLDEKGLVFEFGDELNFLLVVDLRLSQDLLELVSEQEKKVIIWVSRRSH
jgi:hypothetical protein